MHMKKLGFHKIREEKKFYRKWLYNGWLCIWLQYIGLIIYSIRKITWYSLKLYQTSIFMYFTSKIHIDTIRLCWKLYVLKRR